MLKLENSIRGLSFSRVAFDLTIQDNKNLFFYLSDFLIYSYIISTLYKRFISISFKCNVLYS